MLRDGSILPLSALKTNFGLSSNSFLTYAQLKVNLNKLSMSGSAIGSHMEIDEKLEDIAHGRGVVSKLYRLLCI